MKWLSCSKMKLLVLVFVAGFPAAAVLAPAATTFGSEGIQPIADAGLSRYAGPDPIVLDGTGSYDPDNSGTLSYTWQQISGPTVVISGEDTATPTISGFIQTEAIQECEFKLVVSDGKLTSLPDTVKVVIVPDLGDYELELKNDSFDPDKPTIIYFGGGAAVIRGSLARVWSPFRDPPWDSAADMDPAWLTRANIIEFPKAWWPDNSTGPRTYYRCGDVIIVYLSAVAPDYKQAIQVVGHSAGSQPTMDTALRLNLTYKDRRYAINRVTYLDCGLRGQSTEYALVEEFVASSVDGEQCWFDSIESGETWFWPNALSVYATFGHADFKYWYGGSLTSPDTNTFNNGVVGGAYWSVAGPGKNLQLAPTPGETIYRFRWHGSGILGRMDFHDEASYPGRLPEPVTLIGPEDGAFVDADGALFSCEESINAIGYQLLFGSDPHRVMDYCIILDTPNPPSEIVTASPFEPTWWTVKAYDQYSSTIYADPICVSFENLAPTMIENMTTGQRYASIQPAIDDARHGHEIVVSPGIYKGDIDFQSKNLNLRSTDPNNSAIVATTIIEGYGKKSVVTFSGFEDANCVIAGFTITGGTVGISCSYASPTIRNCTIESIPISIEFLYGYEPTIIDCTILGSIMEVYGSDWVAHWKLDETEGDTALDSAGDCNGTLSGGPVWQPSDGIVDGALQFDGIDDYVSTEFVLNPADGALSVFAWIQGGAPGQVIISQTDDEGTGETWLGADALGGNLMTGLRSSGGRSPTPPMVSDFLITDGQWHHVGIVVTTRGVRDLYADGVRVAFDTQTNNLPSSNGGLYFGANKNLDEGTFFSGLIDDVRIYDVALTTEEIAVLTQ